ncbi:MAG: EamA family transporter [Aristaeellaceae bacterium]
MVLVCLVTLMIVFFSFQSLFTRLYSANYAGPATSNATSVFSVCYGVFVAAASFFLGGMSFAPSWQTVLLGLLNAGMLILYNTSIIEAGNRGSYSFLMVASMFGGILVPMAVGVLFLGEQLTGLQIMGVVLMLISLVLMNMQSISLKGASKSYYVWCIALFFANGLYGAINNLQTQVMDGAQRTEMLTILYLGSALAVIAMEAMRGKGRQLLEGFRMGRKSWLYVIIACVSATAAANLLLYILTQMESSILYTIDSGAVLVLSMLYALVLFKEKPSKEQAVGMAAAVVSIVLMNIP